MASVKKRAWVTRKGATKTAWQVYYRDPSGQRQRRQFQTKREADRFRTEIENQLLRGIYRADSQTMTIAQLCGRYLEYCEGRVRRNERMTRKHLTVMRGHITNWILGDAFGLGRQKLNEITARKIGLLRDDIRDRGVSVPTARKILQTLHAALEYAIEQDWLATNATSSVRVIGSRDEKSKRVTPPSKSDLQRIIRQADHNLRVKVIFASATGLRAGEQWALRWSNIDFGAGEIRVRRRVDSYGEEGPPKSAAGVRDLPMSDYLAQMLREWKIASRLSADGDLVFSNKTGRYLCHDNFIKRSYKPTLERIGLNVGWHALRHFAISTWIEQGAQPKTIQTWAGHASLETTMSRYGHLFKDDAHARLMNRISDQLFKADRE